jgi:hypothetical protein
LRDTVTGDAMETTPPEYPEIYTLNPGSILRSSEASVFLQLCRKMMGSIKMERIKSSNNRFNKKNIDLILSVINLLKNMNY